MTSLSAWPKLIILTSLLSVLFCCKAQKTDIPSYHQLANEAELAICSSNFKNAVGIYKEAFEHIDKPFGSDLFNAALSAKLSNNEGDYYLFMGQLVENTPRLDSHLVESLTTWEDWHSLITKNPLTIDQSMRTAMLNINNRDQLYRPLYDEFDDTINSIRKENISQLWSIMDKEGFPSHQEIGYSHDLRDLDHHIVLYHSAQRRSKDKSVQDLEPRLREIVDQGRLDPEQAILYMFFQNDVEKGRFETYSYWRYQHPALPDSLNQKLWFPKLDEATEAAVNELRDAWFGDSTADIRTKAFFIASTEHPFIFPSVRLSIAYLPLELEYSAALAQYYAFTSTMQEYKPRAN